MENNICTNQEFIKGRYFMKQRESYNKEEKQYETV